MSVFGFVIDDTLLIQQLNIFSNEPLQKYGLYFLEKQTNRW